MGKLQTYTAKTTPADTDIMLIEDTTTKKITASNMRNYALNGLPAKLLNDSTNVTILSDNYNLSGTFVGSDDSIILVKINSSAVKNYVLDGVPAKIATAAAQDTLEDTTVVTGFESAAATSLKKFTLSNVWNYIKTKLPSWTNVDSGWLSIMGTTCDSGNLASPTAGHEIKYRRVGNIVYVCGEIGVTNKVEGTSLLLFTLPTGFRTDYNFYNLNTATGTRLSRIYVKSDGTFNLEWVRNVSDGTELTGTINWISIELSYPYL